MSLSRLKRRLGGLASTVTDPVANAEEWLRRNAPSLLDAGEAGLRTGARIGTQLNPVTGLPSIALDVGRVATGRADIRDVGPLGLLSDIKTIGHGTVEEPIAYGLNRQFGNEARSPFSGQERKTLGTAAKDIENPFAKGAAQAGLFGLDIATDPSAYVPLGGLAKAGAVGKVAAPAMGFTGNLGGFGLAPVRVSGSAQQVLASLARSVGQTALAGTALSAGQQAGAALGEEVGGTPGALIGGLVGAGAAITGVGKTGVLGAVPGATTKKLQQRVRAATDPEAQLSASEREVLDLARGANTERYYHGSSSYFERPSPEMFGKNRLYGPGYYVTSDPEVANLYAQHRTDIGMGEGTPQMRAVDIPRNLTLLDTETRVSPYHVSQAKSVLRKLNRETYEAFLDELPSGRVDGGDLWSALLLASDENTAQKTLARIGFDGIRYPGNQNAPVEVQGRSPFVDLVIFPESLSKVRNALSGTEGGEVDVRTTLRLGSVAGGAGAGYLSGELTGESMEEKLRRAAIGGAGGFGVGVIAAGRIKPPPKAVPELAADLTGTRDAIDGYMGHLATRDRSADTPQRLIADTGQVERPSGMQGALAGATARQLGAVLEDAWARGDIVPVGAGDHIVLRFNALPAQNNLTDPIKARVAASRNAGRQGMVAEMLLDGWQRGGVDNFAVRAGAAPEVQQAVDALRGQWDELAAIETRYGVAHDSMVENYLPRKWAQEQTKARAAVPRRPNAKQGFQKARTFESTLEGLEAGLTPGWRDVGDLFEYRVKAGAQAMAGQQVIRALKETPGWVTFDAGLGNGENYRKLDLDIMKRAFPTYDTGTIKGILADIEAGAQTVAEGMRGIREEVGVGQQTPWVRKDVARFLTAKYGANPITDSAVAQHLAGFNTVMKSVKLGYDVAMAGRLGPMLGAAMVGSGNPLNPVTYARATSALYRAFETSVTRGATDDYFREADNGAWAFYLGIGRRGGDENPALGYRAAQGPLARVPVLGEKTVGPVPGLGALEDWQFNHFVPVLQVETAKTLYQNLQGNVIFWGMSEPEVKQTIGRLVMRATGQVDLATLGHAPITQAIERTLLLSPGWTHGYLGLALGTLKANPEGALARRFWATTFAAALTTSVGLSVAFTGDASPEHLRTLLDPTNPDSVTNPNGRGFLKVEMPNGVRVDLWGPFTPLARTALKVPLTGVQTGKREAEKANADIADVAGAVAWGVLGRSPEKSGLLGERGARQWLLGRRSLPIGLYDDLRRNKDFRQRWIATADTERGQWVQRAKFAGMSLIPGIGEVAGITTEQSSVPDLAFGRKETIMRGFGNALGLNVSTPARDPKVIRDTVAEFLATQGQNGGLDPVGYLNSPKVDQQQRADFLAAHPEVTRHIREKRQQTAKDISVPVGRDAARLYTSNRSQLQAQRDLAIRTAGERLGTGALTGNQYRDAVEAAWDAYVGGSKAIAQSTLGLDAADPNVLDLAQQKITRIYGRGEDGQTRRDVIMNGFYSIRSANDTPEAREAMMDARKAYVQGLPASDRAVYDRYREADALSIGGEVYRDFRRAQDVYGEYADLSRYLGMSVEEGRQVSQALSRAGQVARARPGMTATLALLLDKSVPANIKAKAISRPIVNPARARFYTTNAADFARFYSDLSSEQMEQFSLAG